MYAVSPSLYEDSEPRPLFTVLRVDRLGVLDIACPAAMRAGYGFPDGAESSAPMARNGVALMRPPPAPRMMKPTMSTGAAARSGARDSRALR